jgi:hypothetical protein
MSDDKFFKMPLDHQRAQVAAHLGYNPNTPDDWPASAIDDMIAYRWRFGEAAFLEKVNCLIHK